jgi:hypothetical protein
MGLGGKKGLCYFQLHVMDSGELHIGEEQGHTELSTPCNGFTAYGYVYVVRKVAFNSM